MLSNANIEVSVSKFDEYKAFTIAKVPIMKGLPLFYIGYLTNAFYRGWETKKLLRLTFQFSSVYSPHHVSMDTSKSINTSFREKNNTIFQVHIKTQAAGMTTNRPLGLQVKQPLLRLGNY